MSFAVIFEMATLVSFLVIMLGGKATRLRGWSIIAVLIVAVAAVQFSCFSIVVCFFVVLPPWNGCGLLTRSDPSSQAYLFDNDEQFLVPGWHFGSSWYLCCLSAILAVFCAAALCLSAYILPQEDGYELLEDDNLEDVT